MKKRNFGRTLIFSLSVCLLAGCAHGPGNSRDFANAAGIEPMFTFPVTDNRTPYSRCLESLAAIPANNLPVFSVGEVADKTGTFEKEGLSRELTQGATEMVISALHKTGKVRLQERWDLRVPLAEMKLASQGLLQGRAANEYRIAPSDFILIGALTELNYNIFSGGAGLSISGIGGSGRNVVINVALDLRVVNPRTFEVPYVASLQKQIYGYEIEANIFRFFGTELVQLEGGNIQNEPLQLGVRSVAEMAVYQIMTDYLGLPKDQECHLAEANFN